MVLLYLESSFQCQVHYTSIRKCKVYLLLFAALWVIVSVYELGASNIRADEVIDHTKANSELRFLYITGTAQSHMCKLL